MYICQMSIAVQVIGQQGLHTQWQILYYRTKPTEGRQSNMSTAPNTMRNILLIIAQIAKKVLCWRPVDVSMDVEKANRVLPTQSKGFLSHIHSANIPYMRCKNRSSPSLRSRYIKGTSWLAVRAIFIVPYVLHHVLNRTRASDAMIHTDCTMHTVMVSW